MKATRRKMRSALASLFAAALLPVDRPWRHPMTPETVPWETRLVALAHEGLGSPPQPADCQVDPGVLGQAYAACERITREHSRTFMLASGLLPEAKRRAARALYAFCRVSDDLIDHAMEGDPLPELAAWRVRSLADCPEKGDLVAIAWADARRQFGIPVRYAEQLLDGVASDLVRCHYDTFEELAAYAYGVASTVGLMAMHIIGFSGPEAIPYAIKLGVALQVTNILRDVAEDQRNGRLYLPRQELQRFGVTGEDLAAGDVSPRWREFMKFQIERVRRLYAEARPGIAMLGEDGRFAIAAAADLYAAILEDIEKHDYNVFSRRAHIGALGKLIRLPGTWLRTRLPGKEMQE